jgi:DNA-binding beta-propeller fold protein YncE
LALVACSTPTEERVVVVYDAYDGPPAFPNRRPKFELPAEVGLVSNNGSDTLTLLDLAGEMPIGSAPVGRNPIDIDGPHHLAADRAAGFVYIALAYPPLVVAPGPHSAHGFGQQPGWVQKLALDDLRVLGEVKVDKSPGDIVQSQDKRRIVVSHFDMQKALDARLSIEQRRATLAVIDPEAILPTGSPEPTRITTCILPHGVALLPPSGDTALVACFGEDALGVVDLTSTSEAPELIPVGSAPGMGGVPTYGPYAIVLAPDASRVAVSCTESRDVRIFDAAALSTAPSVLSTMGAPYFVAWSEDLSRLYVPVQQPDALQVFDGQTGTPIDVRLFDASCMRPHEVVLSGSTLYVVCEGDHQTPSVVRALDPQTLADRASFPVGVYPDRLVVLR